MIRAEDNVMLESQKSIYDKANASIVTDTLHYLATSQGSGVTTSTSGWTTTVQTMTATNKYLWTYHTYTKANGTTVDTTPVITGTYGKNGTNGVSVTKVEPQYYLSTSATSATGGSWQTTLAYEAGKYIWTREKVTYSSGNPTYSTAIYNSALTTAWINASNAYQIASNTEQHFWTTETGDDTGAHITEKTKEAFLADPQNGGGNLLARSNGVAVRDGLTELATYGASGVQVGKTGSSHVNVGTSSISMSDGQNTVYEVKQASNPIVMTKVFDRSVASYAPSTILSETIELGRTVSSWEKITMNCTLKRGGQTYTYSSTYTTVPVSDSNANYAFRLRVVNSSCYIEMDNGSGFQEGEILILNSVKLKYNTTQVAIESTIGANANRTQGGVFRVGKGADSNSNAMLLDWAGNAMFAGDVMVNCDYDSSGGMSLTKVITTPSAYIYNSESSAIKIDVYQMGMMVTLDIEIYNSNSTASGANVAYPSLAGAHIPTPVGSRVTGATYFSNHAIALGLLMDNNTWRMVCRNVSPSAVTVGLSSGVKGTLTYIWDGNYTDGVA